MIKIKKRCLICNKERELSPYRIKKGEGKFCSQKCYGIWRSKKFRGKNNPSWKGGKVKRICEICKTGFLANLCHIKRGESRFCSKNCKDKWHSENKRGKNNPAWLGGKSFELYGLEFNNKLREQIRTRDNYRCQECFRHQDELYYKNGKKHSLIVHHIDYNKRNNMPENLISLCLSCHAQTSFSRQGWVKYYQKKMISTAQGFTVEQDFNL